MRELILIALTLVVGCAKKEGAGGLRCGPGTREEKGTCVADVVPAAVAAPSLPPAEPAKVKPTEDDLLAVFEGELLRYGASTLAGEVCNAPGDCFADFKRVSPRIYARSATLNGVTFRMQLAVTAVRVEEGDTADYPFEGFVSYTCSGKNTWCDQPKRHEKRYRYSAKSGKWRMK